MSETSIISFGAYIPRRRLRREAVHDANRWFAPGLGGLAKGERAVANWDEDLITMAVEAARDCLIGFDRAEVESVSLASTTLPFADRLNAGIVKEALNLRDDLAACDVTGSQRAATSALLQALRGDTTQLCLAADLRKARAGSEAELMQGDAAAAILVGNGQPIAKLIGSHSVTVDFVDHFRSAGQDYDYAWESRWVRDEGYMKILGGGLIEALRRLAVPPDSIDHAVIPIAVKGISASLAKKVGIKAEAVFDVMVSNVGDSGVAHPLLMLCATLEKAKPGERILVVGFGQGVDVMLFETTDHLARLAPRQGVAGCLIDRQEDANYMRFLFHRGALVMERGMRAEIDHKQPGTSLYRNRKTVLGLVGGRCKKTETVQFPKSDIGVNPNDRSIGTQEDYPLAERHARIITYTSDRLTYSPDPPTYYGTIDFEGGGRLAVEFAEVAPEDVEVGRLMRMVFRIKGIDEQRDFIKYFWKAVPVRKGEA